MSKNSDSVRDIQKAYQEQIKVTYKDHPQLFFTHSSDNLYLQIATKSYQNQNYQTLVTKTHYQQQDIIAQVRGSVISYRKLKHLIQKGKVMAQKLPLLLYLNLQQRLLISPKNITKYLFINPIHRRISAKDSISNANCSIENHHGSKLLVIASRHINSGEQLILDSESFTKTLYRFNPQKF